MGTLFRSRHFFRGQLVEIRSYAEIAAMLDADGKFEGLPFSAEMARYCGIRARVSASANTTCVGEYGQRQMKSTVFLQELRCDGEFHDGCQRNCLLFWKEAWLKPAEQSVTAVTIRSDTCGAEQLPTRRGDIYTCQSTELYSATEPWSRWNMIPWFRKIAQGDLTMMAFMQVIKRTLMARLFGRRKLKKIVGTEKKMRKGDLNLEAGAWVDVKEAQELRAELDANGQNCGLLFTEDMTRYIGGRYQVDFPIKKIILEQSGKMINMTHTVALKSVSCEGGCNKSCPRAETLFWRESWLKLVDRC